jgi:hypothetical protein
VCLGGHSRKNGEPSLKAETAPGAGAALPLRDEPWFEASQWLSEPSDKAGDAVDEVETDGEHSTLALAADEPMLRLGFVALFFAAPWMGWRLMGASSLEAPSRVKEGFEVDEGAGARGLMAFCCCCCCSSAGDSGMRGFSTIVSFPVLALLMLLRGVLPTSLGCT